MLSPVFFFTCKKIKKDKADVVFIDVIQETPDGRVIKHERMSDFSNADRKTLIGCQMTGYLPWGGWRKAALVSLVKNNNLVYGSSAGGEEAIYSFELLRRAEKIRFIKEDLYHYINRPSTIEDFLRFPTLENMKKILKRTTF